MTTTCSLEDHATGLFDVVVGKFRLYRRAGMAAAIDIAQFHKHPEHEQTGAYVVA
jgi:hypothetical protein